MTVLVLLSQQAIGFVVFNEIVNFNNRFFETARPQLNGIVLLI